LGIIKDQRLIGPLNPENRLIFTTILSQVGTSKASTRVMDMKLNNIEKEEIYPSNFTD